MFLIFYSFGLYCCRLTQTVEQVADNIGGSRFTSYIGTCCVIGLFDGRGGVNVVKRGESPECNNNSERVIVTTRYENPGEEIHLNKLRYIISRIVTGFRVENRREISD